MTKRRILFLTGTRADFGKLKPLISAVKEAEDFEYSIFATGMHMLAKFGSTVEEIRQSGFSNIFSFINQNFGEPSEQILATSIFGLSRYLSEHETDLIVTHGDRIETLAAAIVGVLRTTRVAHIEGGEISGGIDELIRHSVTKLAHTHFVANNEAADRLRQLGERSECIHVIGSPDIDIMRSEKLPPIAEALRHYEISFQSYSLVIFHGVATEFAEQEAYANNVAQALIEDGGNFIVVYPNNDLGGEQILNAYRRFEGNARFKLFPSLRFEYFLSLLNHAEALVGNSSAGIHEAPVFGVPSLNIGSRQNGRFSSPSIINSGYSVAEIRAGIATARSLGRCEPVLHFGDGRSAERFLAQIRSEPFWETSLQKQLVAWG